MKPKFRAWTGNEMRYDIVGFDWDESFGVHNAWLGNNIEYNADNFLMNVLLLQYTGLKDKNGVEVYFNDIVEDEYGHRYEVVFEGDCLRCNGIRRIRGGHKPKNRWFGIDLEIIGNRFENPELLKEQNK